MFKGFNIWYKKWQWLSIKSNSPLIMSSLLWIGRKIFYWNIWVAMKCSKQHSQSRVQLFLHFLFYFFCILLRSDRIRCISYNRWLISRETFVRLLCLVHSTTAHHCSMVWLAPGERGTATGPSESSQPGRQTRWCARCPWSKPSSPWINGFPSESHLRSLRHSWWSTILIILTQEYCRILFITLS